jgi:membrane protein DedA with SNARE-associated domain/rhodanese-related sulfurtransferase
MEHVMPFLKEYGYVVLFFWVLGVTMGLPLPTAPLFITVGALAGLGHLNLLLCVGLGACAALLSDFFWYNMGRRRGGKVLSYVCRISLEPDSCVRWTENVFARHGPRSLLITKLVPGLSAVSTPLAGIIRMRMPIFFLFDLMGILIWIGVYTLVGYVFREQLDRALAYAAGMGNTVLVFAGGGLALYILWKYTVRRRFLREIVIARITPEELKLKLDAGEDILIMDVRHSLDFEADPHIIPNALRIPFELLDSHTEVPSGREVVVYCTCPNEASSAHVALRLRQRGVTRVRPLAGGLHAWRDHGYPVEAGGAQKPEKREPG